MSVSLLFAASSPAFAHAQLTGSNPKANSVLFAMPSQIRLQFSDEIIELPGGNVITVTSASGRRIDLGETTVLGNQMTVKLRKISTLGKYTVRYRVISEDGHPVNASYKFSLVKKKKN
jgi:copper resistance protein C